MKLFRGQNAQVWEERLVERGWPQLAAEDMAHFLVGHETQRNPPSWANLLATEEALRKLALSADGIALMAVFEAAMVRERKA